MDRRERYGDANEAMLAMLEGWQASLWTAIPGIVKSFNPDKMTCEIQPSVQALVRSKDDSSPLPGAIVAKVPWWWVTMTLLVDVPVVFQNGGGFALTFPIAPGDEALVVFSSRCIDAWWQSGGVQPQAELRMHDLSDGFAFIGPRSQPRVLGGISTDSVQLRDEAGTTYIELKSGQINIVGNVHVTGGIITTNDVVANGISLHEHEHPNIGDPGGSPFVDKPLP